MPMSTIPVREHTVVSCCPVHRIADCCDMVLQNLLDEY